jgi:predicted dehydrogenase
MAAVLCASLPAEAAVFMLGDPSDGETQQWLVDSDLENRIRVVSGFPKCPGSLIGVALVVNSAYLHKTTVEAAMAAGYHVVCEKPLAFSRKEVCDLTAMALSLGLELFCTNTYLFAGYLENFKSRCLSERTFSCVRITWSDPKHEQRYDTAKSFDSGVPLIIDVLPHVANTLLSTIGEFKAIPVSAAFGKGGSTASLSYASDDLIIEVELARNSSKRLRLIEFFAENYEVSLDFSTEPGVISENNALAEPIDFDWTSDQKPIRAMLLSVQDFFASGLPDPRLGCLASLQGLDMIDGVIESYVEFQLSLFSHGKNLLAPHVGLADYAYAVKEVNSLATRVSPYLAENHPLRSLIAQSKIS